MAASRKSITRPPHGRGEDKERGEAFDHDHEARRERQSVAAWIGEPASSRPRTTPPARPQGLDSAEQRNRHGLETETERKAFDEPMMDAQNLDAASETGEPAG
jgi:hypothetical protein